MDADGSHQHRLTPDRGKNSSASRLYYQLDPAWSPNGHLIGFASWRDGPSHIYVVDSNGKHTRRLTSSSQPDSHPTWSPDAKRIAFVRGKTGAIEIMNSDGTDVRRVTSGLGSGSAGDPAWSPDGRWIAYDLKASGATTSDVWLMHPDGSDGHRLTPVGANSISPTWSPDSQKIAFSSDAGGSMLSIYEIGVSGHGLELVVRPDRDAIEPAWSPDGKLIAFSSDGAIVVVPVGPGTEQVITNPKDNDSSPAWNPVQPAAKTSGY
jgi:TolB protein